MHFSGFENLGVGVAKLTLNLQFDCFVGIFNLNNCNYNIHINMNIKKNYCLTLITISKYNN